MNSAATHARKETVEPCQPGRPPKFAELFCSRFRCTTSAYQRRAFSELLYARARPIAPVLRVIKPSWFAEDLKFIRELGEATDLREALSCAATFQTINASSGNLLRRWLKIRVSGFKASLLAHCVFPRDC
jgi:hypothetical protein